jgi:hypothetical protein
MKNPTKLFFDKTWVGWLNVIILQWLFIRLSYGGEWKILKVIIPGTGWFSDYMYVGRKCKR